MEWSLQPVLLRQEFFTKEIRRLLHGGEKWSQSPVPPRTQRAYETHLSAGSTAVLAHVHLKLEPSPGVAPGCFAYRAKASLTML